MALCNCSKETAEQRMKCLTVLIEAGANANASNKQRYRLILKKYLRRIYVYNYCVMFL